MRLHPLVLLLSFWIPAHGAQLRLTPATQTVLQGEEARFTCSATHPEWTVMLWLLNGTAALTISKLQGVLPTIDTDVTAERGPDSDSWVFVLRSTQRHNQGQVTCDLQGVDRKSATLLVQEKGTVKVFGDDKLAFQGQPVLFECQAAGWHPEPNLQWQVDRKKVSRGEYNISIEESGKSLCTASSNLSVTAARSSRVECVAWVSALRTPLRSGVRLTVVAEVLQDGDDCTVPLAATASVSALLLLVLLCICTVLWFKHRKRANPSPRDATWFDQSVVGRNSVAGATKGKVNPGYTSEVPSDADYNELVMEIRRKMDFASFHKAPDVVHSGGPSLHSESKVCLSEGNSKTEVRRITTV